MQTGQAIGGKLNDRVYQKAFMKTRGRKRSPVCERCAQDRILLAPVKRTTCCLQSPNPPCARSRRSE